MNLKQCLAPLVSCAALALVLPSLHAADWPTPTIAEGPFKPTTQSLQEYKCPDWFRDAKFGIWAHWGPQAVPLDGDWYARGMYEEGSGHYKHHLEHYGHPSTNGYKDIIPLWKAEKWDPERLMALYKKAGARYFVSMGSHHDNFELWNDPLHRWNAVNMGPKRDVVGEWKKAAQKNGLRFGVSEHLGASFTWFQSSHRSDKTGPFAGVPYDGNDPKNWDLYHQPAKPGDTDWYSNDPEWQREWYARIKTLVDNYGLDLLYTDGGIPFGNDVGLSMVAHLYNTDLKKRGSQQVVYNCKQTSEGRWIEDLERGVMPKINPYPWQTDTSIGDWFYNRNWKFRPVSWVITMLSDIVAKNGNLLLNVVQRPDGSLDPEVEKMLEEIAQWNAVNGEAIFDTRPWLVYGEGAVRFKGGNFSEDFAYTSKDIRFTTKGKTLYAMILGWPQDGQVLIRSLAKPAGENINNFTSVSLLGFDGKLEWKQTPEGLAVTFPAKKPCDYVYSLKLEGTDLKPVEIPVVVPVAHADAQGNYALKPEDAEIHGDQLKSEEKAGEQNLGYWDRGSDWASWKVKFEKAGTFQITTAAAAPQEGAEIVIEAAGQQFPVKIAKTDNWDAFSPVTVGKIEIKQAGELEVKVRPADSANWKAINLRAVKFNKAD